MSVPIEIIKLCQEFFITIKLFYINDNYQHLSIINLNNFAKPSPFKFDIDSNSNQSQFHKYQYCLAKNMSLPSMEADVIFRINSENRAECDALIIDSSLYSKPIRKQTETKSVRWKPFINLPTQTFISSHYRNQIKQLLYSSSTSSLYMVSQRGTTQSLIRGPLSIYKCKNFKHCLSDDHKQVSSSQQKNVNKFRNTKTNFDINIDYESDTAKLMNDNNPKWKFLTNYPSSWLFSSLDRSALYLHEGIDGDRIFSMSGDSIYRCCPNCVMCYNCSANPDDEDVWQRFKDFKIGRCECGIFYDARDDRLYLGGGQISESDGNITHTIEWLDMKKEEWNMLPQPTKMQHGNYPVMWIHDYDLLCIASINVYGNGLEYIDLRDNKGKWKVLYFRGGGTRSFSSLFDCDVPYKSEQFKKGNFWIGGSM